MLRQRVKTALITTIIQLPVILWQHMFIAMYIHHSKRVFYLQPLTLEILILMTLATLGVSYFKDQINHTRWYAYWLIPLALIVALIFDSNYIAQATLFISYLSLMFLMKPITVHKVKHYYKNGHVDAYVYKKFSSFNKAKAYVEKKLDNVLLILAKEASSVQNLKQKFMQSDNDYRINDTKKKTILLSSLWYVEQNAERFFEQTLIDNPINKSKQTSYLNHFSDLLKRGNLPDDNRVVPNWLKIKNKQFDDVDFSHNTVDSIVKLSSNEFNEFVSNTNNGLLLTYLSTLSNDEITRFYQYNDDIVKLDENVDAPSARIQFQTAMNNLDINEITDIQRARATLEIPLMVNYSKNIYHKIKNFQHFVTLNYFDHKNENNELKVYDAEFTRIIWQRMDNILDYFEQVLDHFKNIYNESNTHHQNFAQHIAKRFAYLIGALDRTARLTENRHDTSLRWFVLLMLDNHWAKAESNISINKTLRLNSDKKLINFLTTTYSGICNENVDEYLSSLIYVVETHFEWYPINSEACEYALVEMIKSVAVKNVNKENANLFIEFFETLPRIYDELSYEKIYRLKECIHQSLSNYKPQNNKIFKQDGVKSNIVLFNYLLDMEDLYYDGLTANLSSELK